MSHRRLLSGLARAAVRCDALALRGHLQVRIRHAGVAEGLRMALYAYVQMADPELPMEDVWAEVEHLIREAGPAPAAVVKPARQRAQTPKQRSGPVVVTRRSA